MNVSADSITGRVSRSLLTLTGIVLSLTVACTAPAAAQTEPSEKQSEAKAAEVYQTFYLANVTQTNDLNDVLNDLRNMLTRAKIYGVASQNAISIRATPEDMQLAQKIISEIDRPKKVYRLNYTITDVENGKRGAAQHFSVTLVPGERSNVTQGIKVPIITGNFAKEVSNELSQTQYEDVGLKIDASIDGTRLRTHIEESSVSEEKSGVGTQDPIIRQTVLNEITILQQGKPVVLGSIDVPGTSRRQEVEVAAETVP